MDLRMGGITGYETTKIIKHDVTLKDIPVVAFTASAMQHTISKIKKRFDGFLRKPVSKKQVLGMMKKFLAHSYEKDLETKSKELQNSFELSNSCREKLPKLIETLEHDFLSEVVRNQR